MTNPVTPIDWHTDPATIPDDRRDGREVLMWAGSLVVSSFDDGWRDPVGRPVQNATHWADVEGPGVMRSQAEEDAATMAWVKGVRK